MDIGLLSLGEHMADAISGDKSSQPQRFKEIIDAAVLAEQAGFAGFAIGEHHSPKYIASTPPVILAAVAARTQRIRLRSAVSLVVTLDPVRLAEDMATADVISDGRVDIVVGKGIYVEAFELFGPSFEHADDALWEHTDLLIRLLSESDVSWSGRFRGPIDGFTVQPRPATGHLPVWAGLGRSLASAERAAVRGLPLMMGNVLGVPEDAVERLAHYREVWAGHGHAAAGARVAAGSQLHVARTSQEARRRWEPYFRHYYRQMATVTTSMLDAGAFDFAERIGPTGPAICGSPAEVAERILHLRDVWGHDEHYFQMDMGGMPYPLVAESIELMGSEVLPLLQRELATTT